MKLIPTVWSDFYHEYTLEETVEAFQNEGFQATELSLVHLLKLKERGEPEAVGKQLRIFLDSRGFAIPQGHLSFQKGIIDPEAVDEIRRELDLFLAMGIHNAILHFGGGKELPSQERYDRRLESVCKLCDHVKGTPIYLCLENLGSTPETHTAEKLLGILADAGGENLGICLDTGHLHLTQGRGETQQTQREFIRTAGKHLRALHITNNNGTGDDHLMPFSSRYGIQWQEVVKALREVDYCGLFNLEILGENKCPLPVRHAKLKFIRQMVDYMMSEEFLEA